MVPRTSQIVPAVSCAASPVRRAAIEFVRGTASGWGRRELSEWLLCHYSPCLTVDETQLPDGSPGLDAASSLLDDEQVERLILHARSSTLKLLAAMPWPTDAAAHVDAALGAGHVIAIEEPSGERHWGPVGRMRMRLAQRVSSLIVADYLDCPDDYRTISLCRACGDLLFSRRAEHDARCAVRQSVA